MEYRQLGNSGLKISALTLGTMTFGGQGGFARVGAVSLAEARRLIDLVADAGVNLIDTADVYSAGLAEEILGEAMGGKRPPGMLIASKARFTMGPGPNDKGLSRWHLIRAAEASLKRLRTDVIDLYQVHQWDGLTPLEETLEALDTLVRSGKVRYVGCSNFSGWHVMKALEIARREGRIPFVSQQIHYTLQAREAEYELIPISLDQKLGVLVWSPLAGGLLSGKFGPGANTPEGARRVAFDFPPVDKDRAWPVVAVMREIGKAHEVSVARVALAWLLAKPHVMSVIIGAKTTEQLDDNLAAVDLTLSAEEIARLDEVSAIPSEYPGWMFARQGGARRPRAFTPAKA